jgi:hypothetical protein
MPVPGLFDVVVFLEHIDQARADEVEAAVRASWNPIHTDWRAPRFDEGLIEMAAVGYILEGTVTDLATHIREAIVKANGRGCRVDLHIEEVLRIPGEEFVFGPRGGLKQHNL